MKKQTQPKLALTTQTVRKLSDALTEEQLKAAAAGAAARSSGGITGGCN